VDWKETLTEHVFKADLPGLPAEGGGASAGRGRQDVPPSKPITTQTSHRALNAFQSR
jgi:hypothetical protein